MRISTGQRKRHRGPRQETVRFGSTENVEKINRYLQFLLQLKEQAWTSAVEAARWLDGVGFLKDSKSRPGKPLRDLLRAGKVTGQRHASNGRWFIDRI
jgi:hypothetical protein